MPKTTAIYETTGRAQEYNYLAVNLYQGCAHKCAYCYAPEVVHATRAQFFNDPSPRANILNKIEHDARILMNQGVHGPVLTCFTCDPYQPLEAKYQLTGQAIDILHRFGINVSILTKANLRAQKDLSRLESGDNFGVTLTCLDPVDSAKWEPGAGSPSERLNMLRIAHALDIHTWVSCEPVIYPDQTLKLIELSAPYVDIFKVGRLNYHPHANEIDWKKFAQDAISLLNKLGAEYYIKKDLAQYVGKPEGIIVKKSEVFNG